MSQSRNFPEITSESIKSYCHQWSSNPNSFLVELQQLSASIPKPQMISGQYLGQLLSIISKIKRPQNILEVGTFTGYGAISLLQGLNDNGQLITIEKNLEVAAVAEDTFKRLNDHRIKLLKGDATELIPTLDLEFDLVFIDAAKKKYIKHFDLLLPKLKRGSVVIADNVLWKGMVGHPEVDALGEALDAFNQYIYNHPEVENILVPIDDGINIIFKG